ncbi:MAG: hypothetical protein NTX15_03880 [Candidatus Kapabacteria bacterium]|nr:hypothetical protein [Candidatus Kapabacteria bacterium]
MDIQSHTMYRIKYLLGSLITVFSLVYLLFGIVGWYNGGTQFSDILTCFIVGSLHIMGGGWLLVSSLKDYRKETTRVDAIVRHLIRTNAGRVVVTDLARYAEITEEDAREYLERRSQTDVVFLIEGRGGRDTFFFGQQYWNN